MLRTHPVTIHLSVLALLGLAVYANNFDHQYLGDSADLIPGNVYVRSLRHIPLYFADSKTLTRNISHADYRPVLQTSYAINYWISGYRTWSWHLVQIALHVACAAGLYFFTRKLLEQFVKPSNEASLLLVPFATSLLFVVHPTNAGVVNYLSARSSLLVAAFLLPSINLYMQERTNPGYDRTPWLACLLYGLALFTKIEAVAALGVYLLYEVTQTARAGPHAGGFLRDVAATMNRTTWRRLWPFLAITVVYFVCRRAAHDEAVFAQALSGGGQVTPLSYLATQFTAWWYYLYRWFVPVDLIADYRTYPRFASLWEPAVLLALAGWAAVALLLRALYRTRPWLLFVALAALALVSPTSSFLPLTEMVNEHRPYLPLAILSTLWLIPLGVFLLDRAEHPPARALLGGGLAVVAITLSSLTWARNGIYQSLETFTADHLEKAPSHSVYADYGLILHMKGQYAEALEYERKALELEPAHYWTHLALGRTYSKLGDDRRALKHFARALTFPYHDNYTYLARAQHYLSRDEFARALADLEKGSTPQNSFDHHIGLAAAHAGLGHGDESIASLERAHRANPGIAEANLPTLVSIFLASDHTRAERTAYLRRVVALSRDPDQTRRQLRAAEGLRSYPDLLE